MDGWNTNFLLGRPIFRGYVSFREGIYPPTPWSPEAKGKARGEAVHGRDTKVRHELSPEVQANRGRSCVCVAEALVLVFLNGSKVG